MRWRSRGSKPPALRTAGTTTRVGRRAPPLRDDRDPRDGGRDRASERSVPGSGGVKRCPIPIRKPKPKPKSEAEAEPRQSPKPESVSGWAHGVRRSCLPALARKNRASAPRWDGDRGALSQFFRWDGHASKTDAPGSAQAAERARAARAPRRPGRTRVTSPGSAHASTSAADAPMETPCLALSTLSRSMETPCLLQGRATRHESSWHRQMSMSDLPGETPCLLR